MDFQTTYEDHINLLKKLANNYTVTGYDFDDMLQEFTYILWKCVEKYNGSTKFSTYLVTACKNHWYTLHQRSMTKGKEFTLSLDYVYYDDNPSSLLELVADTKYRADKETFKQRLNKVEKILNTFERGEITLLKYFHKLTYKDIGILYGVSGERIRQLDLKNIEYIKGELV